MRARRIIKPAIYKSHHAVHEHSSIHSEQTCYHCTLCFCSADPPSLRVPIIDCNNSERYRGSQTQVPVAASYYSIIRRILFEYYIYIFKKLVLVLVQLCRASSADAPPPDPKKPPGRTHPGYAVRPKLPSGVHFRATVTGHAATAAPARRRLLKANPPLVK